MVVDGGKFVGCGSDRQWLMVMKICNLGLLERTVVKRNLGDGCAYDVVARISHAMKEV